jgi:hypothetical protein
MKKVETKLTVPVRVSVNTTNKNRDRWAQIQHAESGAVLHTGQPSYIKRVAKARYNLIAKV